MSAFVSAKTARTTKIKNKISFDGVPDDRDWNLVPNIGQFTQKDPIQFEPSKDSTDIRFLYDDKYFYIGIKVFKSDKVIAINSRRDNLLNSERIIVSIDTYNNKRNSVSFAVTASGVRGEYFHSTDNEYDRDYAFNPVWEAKSKMTDFGWTAEMRIPLNQLRFNEQKEMVWGLNLNHWAPDIREDSYWVLIPKDQNGWASRFGSLEGLEGIKQNPRIETLPYFANNTNILTSNESQITDDTEHIQKIGVDIKAGIGPNITIDATINPDFGQVEADPALVNLTGFEVRFDERRPFFTEGKQVFEQGGREFFYSRRIGQTPNLGLPGDAFVPFQTDVLGAAKISGRTESGFQFGGLSAVTDRAVGLEIGEDGEIQSEVVEPMTFYNVLSGFNEFNDKQSRVGFILTNTYRHFNEERQLIDALNRNATTGSIEWNHRFQDLTYEFDGHFGFSNINGSASSILVDQLANQRYFQRPGLDHVEVDSNLTSLTGFTGRLRLDKRRGNWIWGGGVNFDTPEFEINDIGFMTSPDLIDTRFNISWRDLIPKEVIREYEIYARVSQAWDFGGYNVDRDLRLRGSLSTIKNLSYRLQFDYNDESFDQRAARGGPMLLRSAMRRISGRFRTDWSKPKFGEISFMFEEQKNGWENEIDVNFEMRVLGGLELSINPYYRRFVEPWQYVTTLSAEHDRTFGKRYIFAKMDQSFFSTRFRLNYAFTGDLTLEFYAEPFISHGNFSEYGEMERAFSRDKVAYEEININQDRVTVTESGETFEFSNPEFNIVSLRTNLVFRWEFIPGSIMFFVWQQNRRENLYFENRFQSEDILDSFNALGSHSLAFKISYWFNAGSLF